jgi:arylsulfatase A-like enzyme
MDSARADRLSCYGHSRPTTPNLDALAARGRRFEQCITPGCWTVPSHASLFTGLYPAQHGAHESMLPEGAGPTFVERLRREGYHTVALSANAYISPNRGFGRGFTVFREIWRGRARLKRGQIVPWLGRRVGWSDNGAARANVLARSELRGCPKPFFLFINYMETHSPYLRFWPIGGRFVGRRLALRDRWRMWRFHRQAREWDQLAEGGAQFPSTLVDLYDEDLNYMDRQIGELLSGLEDEGLLANTLIVVTSDHGENLGEHGLVQHHFCLYDTLLRIPLVVCWEGVVPAGQIADVQVQLSDIAPSVLRSLDVDPVGRGDERPNLLERDLESGSGPPAFAQYELPEHVIERWQARNKRFDFTPFERSLRAIRHEGLKCIVSSDGACELYDLRLDPGETSNIAAEQSSRVRALSEQMTEWLARHPPLATEGAVDGDAEIEAQLRELGYL